jgi:hypothetical protein
LEHNEFQVCRFVGSVPDPEFTMRRTYVTLRILAVVLVGPAVALYIAAVTLLHPVAAFRNRFRTAVRLWMSVMDWVKGIPVGYSYWEQYQAPIMLDEIVVHHED